MAGNEVSYPKDSLGRASETSLALVAIGFANLIRTYPNEQMPVGQVPKHHFLLRIAVYPLAGIAVPLHELPRFRVNFHDPRNIRRNRRTDKEDFPFSLKGHHKKRCFIRNQLLTQKALLTI